MQALIDIVKKKGIVIDEITLSSGEKSEYGFFVRKERNPHGLQEIIEGKIIAPVVILDDVMTTVGSIRLAIEAMREEGFNVEGVFTVLDREENNELRKTFKCFSLLKHSQFKPFIEEHVKRKQKTKIEN